MDPRMTPDDLALLLGCALLWASGCGAGALLSHLVRRARR